METRQYDRVLRCLERRLAASNLPRNRNMRERIRGAVSAALMPPEDVDLRNHAALLALSRDVDGRHRLLTTNFDTLFEKAWHKVHGTQIASHSSVALPQPRSASAVGVLHLHGRQADAQLNLTQTDIVLTSAEFGDAYLRTGWASRYVYDLARADTLVLVGYLADDPPMRYLLEALEADRERFPDLKKVYAFGACAAGDEVRERARWQAKGVEPILYHVDVEDHGALYATLREWERYAADPTAWRRERLQEQLNAQIGAPSDARIQACLAWLDRGDAAQLLVELSPPSSWLPMLMQRGVFKSDALPAEWIASRIDDPDMIRACAALEKLDAASSWSIERALARQRENLSPVRERAWRLLLAVGRANTSHPSISLDWHDGLATIRRGRFDFQLRDLVANILRPRLTVATPILWPGIEMGGAESLRHLLRLDFESIHVPSSDEVLRAWPDAIDANMALMRVLDRTLVDALERAYDLGLLERILDTASHDVASVAEHAQNQPHRGFYPITRTLAGLWTRIARDDPEQARIQMESWQASPYLLLRRLALFAQRSEIVEPEAVARALQALDDHTLWMSGAQVEIMHLLIDRWAQFAEMDRQALEMRLRTGIPLSLFEKNAIINADEWQTISDASIYRRLSRIRSSGGALMPESHDLLKQIQARHPTWAPGAGDRDDFPSWHELRHGPHGHSDLLAGIPDDKVVQEAFRLQIERQFDEGDLWRVFCAADPERALRGLIVEGDEGLWRTAWQYLLWAAAEHKEVGFHRAVEEQILRMPEDSLALLLDSAASWIERRPAQLSEPDAFGHVPFLPVWDRLAVIAYVHRDPSEAQEDYGGDLVSEALNRPGGHLASALLYAMDAAKPPAGAELPPDFTPRFDRIVAAENRAGLLGRVLLIRKLAYLDVVAPAWTAHQLVPRLDWLHPEALSMWKGYAAGNMGSSRLFMALKHQLLAAFCDKGL